MVKWNGVSTTKHQLMLYDDNSLIKTYPIATGKILTQTPFGIYTIINKQLNLEGTFGVMWMGLLRPHYRIHGTNNPSSVGKSMSHGCIQMYNHGVLKLSLLVPIGTRVVIHK